MPVELTGKTQPFFSINPAAKTTMTADTYIEKGKLRTVSFDDDVELTFKDGFGNEDTVSLPAFPVSMGLDSATTHLKVNIDTVLHGMFG